MPQRRRDRMPFGAEVINFRLWAPASAPERPITHSFFARDAAKL